MSKSFRIDPELQRRLAEAAEREDMPASQLIREAVRQRCDEILGHSLLDDLGDVVGSIGVGGDESGRTGRAFADLLVVRSEK